MTRVLPVGWVKVALACVAFIRKEKHSAKNRHDQIPSIDLEDIAKATGQVVHKLISPSDNMANKHVFYAGDTLFGKLRPNLRKYAFPNCKGVCSSEIWVMQPNVDKVHDKFLFYIVQSEHFIQAACKTSGTKMPRANWEVVKSSLVSIPQSIEEQKAIAAVLSKCDDAIAATESLITAKQSQFRWLHAKLMGAHTHHPKLSLEQMENQNLVTLGRGNIIPKTDFEKFLGDYPVYSSSVKNNGVMGRYGKYMYDDELITWSVDGGGNFFYRDKHKFSVTNVCGFIKVNTDMVNYLYLASQLQLLHSKIKFDYQFKAHPSVIKKIYKVHLPPLAEQKATAKAIRTAQKEIALLEQLVAQQRAEKRALMQNLLTGKWRVK